MLLKILNYFLPLITFLVSYQYYKDIYFATKSILVVTLFQIIFILINKKKLNLLNLINFVIIFTFGSLTLYTNNNLYIKLKPTIIYICLSIYLYTNYIYKKNIFINIIDSSIVNKIYINWMIFFILLSIINIFIVFSNFFNDFQWVIFKTFGTTLMTLIFIIFQYYLLKKD